MVVDDTTGHSNMATAVSNEGLPLGMALDLSRLEYAGAVILENLHLQLRPGKFTCLLGPSGVGKTSILKLIAGTLSVENRYKIITSDNAPLTGRVAYMDQKDLLLPWATALENVTIGDRLRGQVPNIDKARRLLAEVGLKEATSKKPGELSGGMRQRVALARTLMEDAPLVLLDEPFSALDAISRHSLQSMTAEKFADRTVLMITHDPLEALRLGDEVMVLSGRPARLQTIDGLPKHTPREATDPTLHEAYTKILHLLQDEGVIDV